jgi:hypothetical protein
MGRHQGARNKNGITFFSQGKGVTRRNAYTRQRTFKPFKNIFTDRYRVVSPYIEMQKAPYVIFGINT